MENIYPKAIAIYADDDFIPVFGYAYDAAEPATLKLTWRDLQSNCRSDPFIRAKGQEIWVLPIIFEVFSIQPPPTYYGGSFSTAAVIHAIRSIRERRHEVKARLSQSYPALAESYDAIGQQLSNAKRDFAILWPREASAFEQALAQRKQRLSKSIISSWRADMNQVSTAEEGFTKIPDGLKANAKFIAAMADAERDALRRELAGKLTEFMPTQVPNERDAQLRMLMGASTLHNLLGSREDDDARIAKERIADFSEKYVVLRLAETEKFGSDLEGLSAALEWQENFQRELRPLAEYAAVKRAHSTIEKQVTEISAATVAVIRDRLADPHGHTDFLPIRDAILKIDKVGSGLSVSKPLWEQYSTSANKWMSSQLDASGHVKQANSKSSKNDNPLGTFSNLPGANAPETSPFLTTNLSEARVIRAIYQKKFVEIYRDEASPIVYYLMNFSGMIDQLCPGTVPMSAKKEGMKARLGVDVFAPGEAGRNNTVELGGQVGLDFLRKMAHPNEWLNDVMSSEEILKKATGDAYRLPRAASRVEPCDDPGWQTKRAHEQRRPHPSPAAADAALA